MMAGMDVALLVLGSSLLLFAPVLTFLGASYRPEWTPLSPTRPRAFGVGATSFAVAGALVLALGALGWGGVLVVGVAAVALGVARR
jgi:hypothetical protein